MSKQDELDPKVASSMDDIFRNPDSNETMDATKLAEEFENRPQTQPQTPQQKFQPKVNRVTKTENLTQIPSEDLVTEQRIKDLESQIKQLVAGMNGVKIGKIPEKPAPIDFSKLTEDAVYDLEIPIEAVEHELPDWLTIDLKDKNYTARWIHKTPRRLGPMLAQGWTYVEPEDLDPKSPLTKKLTTDVNGHFSYDDVVACKLTKAKYFGQLRRNHERALMQVNPKFHHERSKKAVEGALQNAPAGGRPGKNYADYVTEGKLAVYVPGEK